MRMSRLSVTGAIMLTLLVGLSGAVLAQDDPMAPATVTGSVRYIDGIPSGERTSVDEAVRQSGVSLTNRWTASDPRLSGTETYAGTWDRYAPGFQVEATTHVLENDVGRWVGTGAGLTGAFIDTDSPLLDTHTIILHGEGEYEGLTAYVLMEWNHNRGTFVGAIFPGEMPPLTEPSTE